MYHDVETLFFVVEVSFVPNFDNDTDSNDADFDAKLEEAFHSCSADFGAFSDHEEDGFNVHE